MYVYVPHVMYMCVHIHVHTTVENDQCGMKGDCSLLHGRHSFVMKHYTAMEDDYRLARTGSKSIRKEETGDQKQQSKTDKRKRARVKAGQVEL